MNEHWYYHENSDDIFLAPENGEFGMESEFVWDLGIACYGTYQEGLISFRNRFTSSKLTDEQIINMINI